MKFFTSAILATDDPDEGEALDRSAHQAYLKHVESLNLPVQLERISAPDLLHDGIVARIRQSDQQQLLTLTLRCGFLPIGYFDLEFDYAEPEVDDFSLGNLALVASRAVSQVQYGAMDVWCHELDISRDGRFLHSILFHQPGGDPLEFSVRCKSITVQRTERKGRRLPPFSERFRFERFNTTSAA